MNRYTVGLEGKTMHIHASMIDGLIIAAYLVIIMFLMRLLAVRWADNSVGKALAFIH